MGASRGKSHAREIALPMPARESATCSCLTSATSFVFPHYVFKILDHSPRACQMPVDYDRIR